MALNKFENREALEIAISVRDKLELDCELELKERWKEKDALAQVINLAEKYVEEKECEK